MPTSKMPAKGHYDVVDDVFRYTSKAGAHFIIDLDFPAEVMDAAWVDWTALVRAAAELPQAFAEAMDDDLGVPRALAAVYEALRIGNAQLAEGADAAALKATLTQVRAMLDVLGLSNS